MVRSVDGSDDVCREQARPEAVARGALEASDLEVAGALAEAELSTSVLQDSPQHGFPANAGGLPGPTAPAGAEPRPAMEHAPPPPPDIAPPLHPQPGEAPNRQRPRPQPAPQPQQRQCQAEGRPPPPAPPPVVRADAGGPAVDPDPRVSTAASPAAARDSVPEERSDGPWPLPRWRSIGSETAAAAGAAAVALTAVVVYCGPTSPTTSALSASPSLPLASHAASGLGRLPLTAAVLPLVLLPVVGVVLVLVVRLSGSVARAAARRCWLLQARWRLRRSRGHHAAAEGSTGAAYAVGGSGSVTSVPGRDLQPHPGHQQRQQQEQQQERLAEQQEQLPSLPPQQPQQSEAAGTAPRAPGAASAAAAAGGAAAPEGIGGSSGAKALVAGAPEHGSDGRLWSPFTTAGAHSGALAKTLHTPASGATAAAPAARSSAGSGGVHGGGGGGGEHSSNGSNSGSLWPSRWSYKAVQGWYSGSRARAPSLQGWVPLGSRTVSDGGGAAATATAAFSDDVTVCGTAVGRRPSVAISLDGAEGDAPSRGADGVAAAGPVGLIVSGSGSGDASGGTATAVAAQPGADVATPVGPATTQRCGIAAAACGGRDGGDGPSQTLSYVVRLWRVALPGLHLLSRPQRHSPYTLTRSDPTDAAVQGRPAAVQGRTVVAPTGWPTGGSDSNGRASPHQYGWYGVARAASVAAASAAAALCGGVGGLVSTRSPRGSSSQVAPGGGGGGGGGHVHRTSSSSVISMVSDLLPRVTGVTGRWRPPRSASNTSLAALVETTAANGGGSGGGSIASAAGGGGGGGARDPPLTNNANAHALLLSSAEAAARKPAFSDLPQNAGRVRVLSVDDEPVNQQVMRALLWAAEYDVLEARSGEDALEMIRSCEVLPDLVLLDVTLGGSVSGFEVCLEIRREYSPGELPVIMITCSSLEEDVIRGLAVGANDYLIKPLRNLELMARIKTQLALKRSIRVAAEARVNRSLLGSILPSNVIRQLKQGVTLIAQFHEEVTILFSDIRGFTNLATEWPTEQIILMLNNMFTAFDRLCDQLGVYKVETIGDAYMIVSGHDGVEDHAVRMLRMATHMLEAVTGMRGYDGRELQIRVGIHTGPAHSGVVGLSRPRYCFFGDTVNTASRMESTGFPMAVQVSESTLRAVTSRPEWADEFEFAPCGPRDIKGKGTMHTFLLRTGLYEDAIAELAAAARAAAASGPRRRAAAQQATAAAAEEASGAARGEAEAAPPAPRDDAMAAATAAGPLASKPSATGGAGGTGGGSFHLRIPIATAAAASTTTDPGGDIAEHVKYASYRYHHHHHQGVSGVDAISSGGTNALMDNGLAVLLPSHVMDGSMLDSLENPPSAVSRCAATNASSGGGAGAGTVAGGGAGAAGPRPVPGFSGSMSLAYMPPASPRRLAAAAPPSMSSKGYGSSSTATTAAAVSAIPTGAADSSGTGIGSTAPYDGRSVASLPSAARPLGAHRSRPTSPMCVGGSGGVAASPRKASMDMSNVIEELSLQYALDRAMTGAGGGAALAPARLLSAGAALHGGVPPCMAMASSLRRSTGRTSEELTAAAAGPPPQQVSLDLEALLLAQRSLENAPDTSGGGGGLPLTGHMAGWSLLVEALEPNASASAASAAGHAIGGVAVSRTSTSDVTQTLGAWAQACSGVCSAAADSHALGLPLPTAPPRMRSRTASDVTSATTVAAARASADASLVAEPTLAVAAEALAAAVDSALNSDTGDHLLDSRVAGMMRHGGGGASGGGAARSLLARLPSAPLQVSASAPAPLASAGRGAAADTDSRTRPMGGCPASASLAATLPPSNVERTVSNASVVPRPGAAGAAATDAAAAAGELRLSFERPATGPPAGGLGSGDAGAGGSVHGSGGGGVAADVAHPRLPGAPSGVGNGGGSTTGNTSFSGASALGGVAGSVGAAGAGVGFAVGGLYSPRDAGGSDPWVRPQVGKRPATATGTVSGAANVQYSSIAAFFSRGTAPPSMYAAGNAGGGAGPAPAAAGGGGSGGGCSWSPATGAVQRSVLCAPGSSGRQRPATAHGATTIAAGTAPPPGSGYDHLSAAAGGPPTAFRDAAAAAAAADGPPAAAAGAGAGAGDDMPYRSGWAMASNLAMARQDSAGSSRAGTLPARSSARAYSRKSFSYAPRQYCGASFGHASHTGHTSHTGHAGHSGAPAAVLLTSAGSMGGVSIISQGWSNLYDPLCPRPRLTDHYYASGDFDDFGGSGGARTPVSLRSPSLGSAHQHGDYSAQPSPTLLTPAHSSMAATTAAAVDGAADTATAPQHSASARSGGGGGGGGGLQRAAWQRCQGQMLTAATAEGRCGGGVAAAPATDASGGGGYDQMFGDMSGVTSGHDVAYGTGEGPGDGGDAETPPPPPPSISQGPARYPYGRVGVASLAGKSAGRADAAPPSAATTAQQLGRSRSMDVACFLGGGVGGGAVAAIAGDSAYGVCDGPVRALYAPACKEAPKGPAVAAGEPHPHSAHAPPPPQQQVLCHGSPGRSAENGSRLRHSPTAAAAPARVAVPAVEPTFPSGFAASNGSGGNSGAVQSPTGGAVPGASPYSMNAVSNPAAMFLYNRRHSVDDVRQPAPGPAAGSGGAAVSPNSRNLWYAVPDSAQVGVASGGTADAAAAAAAARLGPTQSRASADPPRRLGPGPFGSPIVALGQTAAAGAAAAAAVQADGGGGGGLDIARMLARASELVAVMPQGSSGDGDGDLGGASVGAGGGGSSQYPWSPHASGAVSLLGSMNADVQWELAAAAASESAPSPTVSTAATAAAAAAAAPGWPDETAPPLRAADGGGALGPALPFHVASNDSHCNPLFHHHHHHHHHGHHQAMPYGMTQGVHVTRLDPVEEGGGSSTALTADASSSSVTGNSARNALAGVAASAGGGGGAAAPSDAPPAAADGAFTASTAATAQRHSDCHPNRHRLLPFQGASSLAAATGAASLSNSGPGYNGNGGIGASASPTSTSPAATPQGMHATSARWDAAAVGAVGNPDAAQATVVAAAAQPPPPPPAAKRSFSSLMLKKVKKALRAGGSSGGGSGGGADSRP